MSIRAFNKTGLWLLALNYFLDKIFANFLAEEKCVGVLMTHFRSLG